MIMIVNAQGLVAGRLASKVAKQAINGESIIVVNAEKVVLVGKKSAVMPKFEQRRDAGVKSNPHYGPKYDRVPSKMFRRMVRGMLPNKKTASERLLKKIKVYNSVPKELLGKEMQNMDDIKCNEKHDFMTLAEVAQLLGGKW